MAETLEELTLITDPVVTDSTFAQKMDKTNSLLAALVRENAPETVDWLMLEEYAHEGIFGDLYSYGDMFVDTWKDKISNTEYSFPWRLNHIGQYKLGDGEVLANRPCLQLHHTTPFGIQFSHQRAITSVMYKVTTSLASGAKYYFKRTSDWLQFTSPSGGVAVGYWLGYRGGKVEVYDSKGNFVSTLSTSVVTSSSSLQGTSLGDAPTMPAKEYYFTLGSNWGKAIAGSVVSFNLTTTLTFGQKVYGCYDMYSSSMSSYKIWTCDASGATPIESSLATGTSTAGTNMGVLNYSARNGNGDYLMNSMQEVSYGWNRWKTSAFRQWLNSSAGQGAWWKPQDVFDIAPNELTTRAGFLSGCSEAMLSAIKTVEVKTLVNTVQDGTRPDYDITYDKVFLPSLDEMYIESNDSSYPEADVHEYWKRRSGRETRFAKGGTYPELIHYSTANTSSAQYVRLRSCNRGYAYNTWHVNPSGSVNNGNAYNSTAGCPLVVL